MCETYEGSANYETYQVKFWLDVDDHALEIARESKEKTSPLNYCANTLRRYVENSNPLSESTMYADLLRSALDDVAWYEIANAYLAEVASEV